MSKNKLNICLLFVLLALMLFVKCVLFHYMTFGSILVSSVWTNAFEFWKFYLPKLSISVFIASFVFLLHSKWWTVLFSGLIDTWILANLYYFRSNGIFIDVWSFTMIGNLKGFGDSILLLMSYWDFIFPCLTCLYASIIALLAQKHVLDIRMVWMGVLALLLALDIHAVGMRLLGQERYMIEIVDAHLCNEDEDGICPRTYTYFNPFSIAHRNALFHVSTNDFSQEVKHYSIVHSLICDMVDLVTMKTDICFLSDNEHKIVESRLLTHRKETYKRPVVLILVESLENWAVREDVMPHLYQLAHRDSALYVSVKSQVRAGNSADGQMIINTGLLPLTSGAAAFRFPYNKYPSWPHQAGGKAVTIIPHSSDVWNQEVMSKAYGYDTTIVRGIEDSVLMQTTIDCLHDGFQVVQVLTMSSHSPFSYGAEHSTINTQEWMPEYMANYLKSLACFDDALGLLIHAFDTDSAFRDALLIITGDHVIFPLDKRTEYSVLARNNGANYDILMDLCPFVIVGGGMNKIENEMQLYQMDIYPTILSALGDSLGGWQGWGQNLYMLSDSTQREIVVSEAQYLSDKMIRMDFFSDNGNRDSDLYKNYNYIAHAGGAVDGFCYTNSMEAVQHALSCGIRYIELDLQLSADSQLVAAHDWKHFNAITSHVGDSALTLNEFRNRRIFGKYTPITWIDIDTLLNNHPDIYIVTDKTSNPDVLNKFLWRHRSHVMVECFCMDDYVRLKNDGYTCFYSSCPKSKTKVLRRRVKNLLRFSWEPIPTNYAFWYLGAPNEIHFIEDYKDGYGDSYAVFSVDNRSAADSIAILDKRIKYVYIDNVE